MFTTRISDDVEITAPEHTPAQWRQLIDAQATSGLSQVAFCAEHSLATSSVLETAFEGV